MKAFLRTVFAPILTVFESGDEAFSYKASQRTILLAVASLFSLLAVLVCVFTWNGEGYGFLIPVVVFSCASLVCFVVGFLGNERAIAKIWGNK